MTEEKKYLVIKYGGSNRKLKEHLQLLKAEFGDDFRAGGHLGIGGHHSNHWGSMPNTEAAKAWVKNQKGIRIARSQ